MLNDPQISPVLYSPSVERPEADEDEIADKLMQEMRKVSEITFKDGGHAIRSVHAKSHGILDGTLEVYPDLPPVLAQGLFAAPGAHPAILRLSTLPGDILDDSVSTPRGLAIKVLGVEGDFLPGAQDGAQDFVLVNAPAFSAPNGKAFLANLKLLAATTDRFEGAKKALSAVNRGLEHVLEAFGGKSATLLTLGGQPETHILGESFYSQAPIRYGDYIAKIGAFPLSPNLKALTGQPVDLKGKPNGLRETVIEFFAGQSAQWEIRVQLCTDLDAMPVENAAKVWDEAASPYQPVGRITVLPQPAWTEEKSARVDDGMAFSPWRGLAAHRPLGSIMRLRKTSYEMSARFRESHNRHAPSEPRSFADYPPDYPE